MSHLPYETPPALPGQPPSGGAPAAEAIQAPLVHADIRFEPTDVNVRGVLLVLLGAFVIIGLLLAVVLLLFRGEERHEARAKASSLPLAAQAADRLPPEPRLEQLDRLHEIETSNIGWRDASDESRLHSYGPTDAAGYIHVPIDWAMDEAAKRLPVAESVDSSGKAAPTKSRGLLDAGEPGSDQTIQGPRP
jgi:hypothetical protein